MSKLSSAFNGFLTGDLVVTYYPTVPNRVMHVTLFLRAQDSPLNKPSFVHAFDAGVQVDEVSKYADKPGFLHLRALDETQRAKSAEVAKTWAQTAPKTPYGAYPRTQDVGKQAAPNANRFSGMKATASLAEIPLDFTALARLLKWTYRAHSRTSLSEHRGITCAAFISACHQSAAMLSYLHECGALDKIESAYRAVDKMLETKAELRSRLALPVIIDKSKTPTGKPVYKGQALRANSNRPLVNAKAQSMTDYVAGLDVSELYEFDQTQPIGPLDLQWVYVQEELLGISHYVAKPLGTILPQEFRYDVKYINSPLLTGVLHGSPAWHGTPYTEF